MTNYIKDISKWRNNIFEGEYNKSTIEYILKLQYFNNDSQPILDPGFEGKK